MKTKLSIIGLSLLATTSAFAQSSVTLYGLIDEGIGFTNNSGGHKAWQMQSGWVAGDRWGVKGTEDLGGGYKAVFALENGFDLNSGSLGQGGRMFGRQAYVGVQTDRFGSITAGRQYDSVVDYLAPLTANGGYAGWPFPIHTITTIPITRSALTTQSNTPARATADSVLVARTH